MSGIMAKWKSGIAIAAVMSAAISVAPVVRAQAPDAPVVQVAQGQLKGVSDDAVDRFLGIPFAAPPVGARRWAAPAAPANWKGVRDAITPGNRCPQNGRSGELYRNEDCLTLDIFRPRGDTAKKPVLVYIYGGAFVIGSSQDMDGGELARRSGSIVVMLNYRLGVLGFASTPELDREIGGHSGNYGIMDQQAALRWVQANIAAFGGDPANVTLAGQSSGSMSVWDHMASPASRGLFAKAVMISGPGSLPALTSQQEQADGPSAKLAERLGCAGKGKATLSCMRAKSTDEVLTVGGLSVTTLWRPVIDGAILPASVVARIDAGQGPKIPIISGNTAQEVGGGVQRKLSNGQPWTAQDYDIFLAGLPMSQSIRAAYPLASYPTPDDAFVALSTDRYACMTIQINRKAAAAGATVYTYEFNDRSAPSPRGGADRPVGAFHGFDLPYFFLLGYARNARTGLPTYTPNQLALAGRMADDLKALMWTGVPGPAGRWAPGKVVEYHPQGDEQFGLDAYADRNHCDIWDKVIFPSGDGPVVWVNR